MEDRTPGTFSENLRKSGKPGVEVCKDKLEVTPGAAGHTLPTCDLLAGGFTAQLRAATRPPAHAAHSRRLLRRR